MSTDDLSAPLGQRGTRARRKRSAPPFGAIAAAALALPPLVFLGWAMLTSDPFGGEPMAVAPASVESAAAPEAPAAAAPPTQTAEGTPAPNGPTVTIIDGSTGTRRDVVLPANTDSPAPPATAAATPEQRLSEPSRHGPLPKIGPDGTRPADAFARPVGPPPAGRANPPRIALIVAGLGIGANTTADALRKLPGAITLAFAPYGNDLERTVARARDGGHELMLQVPMEPPEYPDNDPGPHTLLTSLDAGQNLDRLHWLMSRFPGYVGVINGMGGRFTASEQGLGPVLREIATRGLLYVDDGSSPRSLASQIAGANNLAFAKADLVIDQVPTAADVDRALGRLEAVARSRGSAIGVAGALPVSIDRIVRWVKAAEARGIQLVPVSAVAARPKSS